MTAGTASGQDVRDPVTGEVMVPVYDQDAEVLARRVTENTGIEAGAQRVARAIREKQEQFGRLFRNPRTGYQMRVKSGERATGAQAGEADAARAARSETGDRGESSQGSEADRLRARLRELEA